MEIVDLSHPIHDGMDCYFPLPRVAMWTFTHHEVTKKLYINSSSSTKALFLSDHTGTHVDAPLHFDPEGGDVAQLPLAPFVSRGAVLDVSHLEDRAEIGAQDLAGCPNADLLGEGFAALVRTGRDKLWGDPRYVDHPHLTGESARWFLEKGVGLVGIDALSMDSVHVKEKAVHNTLLKGRQIPTVENLCRLELVGEGVFIFIALPLHLVGATGSPVRAVGLKGVKGWQ
ncbi:MAG: cyclase family protein [Candidatus Hydrothermarchaeota archaeon]